MTTESEIVFTAKISDWTTKELQLKRWRNPETKKIEGISFGYDSIGHKYERYFSLDELREITGLE